MQKPTHQGEVELGLDDAHASNTNAANIPGSSSTYYMSKSGENANKPTTGNCCTRMTKRDVIIVAVASVVALAMIVVSWEGGRVGFVRRTGGLTCPLCVLCCVALCCVVLRCVVCANASPSGSCCWFKWYVHVAL